MRLTLVLTLLTVTSTFAWRLGNKRDFIQVLQDENSAPLPSIDFTYNPDHNWEENVHGELGVGRKFKINYNGARLPGRPTMYGQPSWKIYVEYKFNDGPHYVSEDLGAQPRNNIFQKEISIPVNATKVVIWFRHWSYNGGIQYDSDYGNNYNFAITKPSIVFENDWNERVHGDLVPGGHFDLFYDSRRLKEGVQVEAQMKFVDDTVITKALDVSKDSSYQTSVISIPDEAEKLVMWFYYEDKNGKKHWDSDYGNNYHFNLSE